ncbi:MAG: cupin domain-containing protein [Alphaproteobacteria bacterium]|nr:cupin domain-containing protein [Alphaproteobacteria bacterium]
MTPGWIPRPQPILWHEPNTPFKPAHWEWRVSKAGLDAAGRLINTELAERRNLVMRNPSNPNGIATTRTLVSAYQMILPGEKARSHRHAPHALRVILDSRGSYSVVDGNKHPMETGDIVLTPGWCWHGHGHDGDRPAYWFDGLDVPLNHLLEPMFFEEHPDGFERVHTLTETSPYRFAWADTQRALETAPVDAEGFQGRRIRLEAPSMPTMALSVNRWDTGFRSRPYRAVANQIFVVMQGAGRSTIGEAELRWSFGDVFCAPVWKRIQHAASADAVVFSMSDEALMKFCHYYRHEALD